MDYPGLVKITGWLVITYLYSHIVGGRLPSFIFYTSVLIIGISLLWLRILAGVEVSCRLERTQSQVGKPVRMNITVANKSFLPVPWLRCWLEMPTVVKPEERFKCHLLSLRPHESCSFSADIPCQARGEFQLWNITLQSGDLFGIFEDRRIYPSHQELLVLPQVTMLNSQGYVETVHMIGDHNVNLKSSMRGFSFFGIRSYDLGDGMNRIHWKASARAQKLLVKDFERQRSREMALILDLNREGCFGREPDTTLEKAVSIAASVAATGLKEGCQVGMVAQGSDRVYLRPQSGRGHLGLILERLARVRADSDESFADTAFRESTGFPKGARLVLVTSRLTAELVDRLYQIAGRGYHCILILLKAETFGAGDGEAITRTRLMSQLLGKIPVFTVDRESDLRAALGGVDYGAG